MTFIPEDFPNFEQQEARLERALAAFPPTDQERIRAAHTFAARAHEGQERHGPGHIPYLIHPIRVACSLVDEFREVDADAFVAALLHDVVEDCGVTIGEIERRFGPRVRRAVAALTWRKGTDAKWQQAAVMRRQARATRLIKASDVIDNSRAMWQVDGRSRVLRLLYGYGHWGRSIVESLGAPATIFLDAALAKSTTLHFEKDPDPPLTPNAGAELAIEMVSFLHRLPTTASYARYPIRTHVVTSRDDLVDLVRRYAVPYLRPSDLLAISERIVAITQGRAFPISAITPSWWARFLVRFVTKSPYGIGLGSPWTMELAIREAGLPRILLAAAVAAITKPFGIRGLFYRVVGKHINAIDGPCDYTLTIPFGQQSHAPSLRVRGGWEGLRSDGNSPSPPLTLRGGKGGEEGLRERYAKLGPKDPEGTATRLAREIGVDVAIIDANDIGVNVLGVSEGVDRSFVRSVFKDNPLGQSDEQTPMAIVRPASLS